jgi:hypothetical protein
MGNYVTRSFTFNPDCGFSSGNNAANVVQVDGFPLHTNFPACVWGPHPSNWVFLGPVTYETACGFGQFTVGPMSQIVRVT